MLFENDLENIGLTLTTVVPCIAVMTGQGGKQESDKGREDNTTVYSFFPDTMKSW